MHKYAGKTVKQSICNSSNDRPSMIARCWSNNSMVDWELSGRRSLALKSRELSLTSSQTGNRLVSNGGGFADSG